MKKAVILGGGVTGLRIAELLQNGGFDVTVVEKEKSIGGLSASFAYKNFILDYGPHKFYTQLPRIYDDFKEIVGKDKYLAVKKKNSLRLLNNYFDFPVKISQLLLKIDPFISTQIMFDFLKERLKKRKIISYEDYFIHGFGRKGYSLLFEGFAEKVWGDPKKISKELARKRSPVGNIFDVVKTALIKNDQNVSAQYFYYPKKGIGVICESLASKILKNKGKIITEAKPERIILEKENAKFVKIKVKNSTRKIPCDVLVSTISIKDLPKIIYPSLPKKILEDAEKLKYRSSIISYIFVKKSRVLKDNWIFFPEKKFCFSRVAEQKSFSPFLCPENESVLTAEIPCDFNNKIYHETDDVIKSIVIKDLKRAGILEEEDVYNFFTKKLKLTYPVYEIGYKEKLDSIIKEINKTKNLFSVGRLGLFNYNNMDHCLDMAKVTANIIIKNKGREKWDQAIKYFNSYRIVD